MQQYKQLLVGIHTHKVNVLALIAVDKIRGLAVINHVLLSIYSIQDCKRI